MDLCKRELKEGGKEYSQPVYVERKLPRWLAWLMGKETVRLRVGYERVPVRWVVPDGKGGFRPK